MPAASIQRTIEAVWRMESAKIIAKLARMLRDVGLAEELAQDALVTALEQWPVSGVPNKLCSAAFAASRLSADVSPRSTSSRKRMPAPTPCSSPRGSSRSSHSTAADSG